MFEQKNINKDFVAVVLMAVTVSVFVFCGVIFWDYDRVEAITVEDMVLNSGEVMFSIDGVRDNPHSVEMHGWSFKKSTDMGIVQNYILLRDSTDNTYIKISTKMEKRSDLNEAFKEKEDYSKGGFFAKVNKWHLTKNHKYEICIWYATRSIYITDKNNILVPTGRIF